MGRAVFHPVGCLAWVLEPTGCWMWPGLGAKMSASRRAHANEYSLILLPPVSLSPEWATTGPSPWHLPRPIGRYCPVSYEGTVFGLGPGIHKSLCVSSKSGVSVSLSPVEFLWSRPAGFQSQMLWGLLFPVQTPRLGSLTWGSELSLLWENFCDIIILQFVGCPTRGYGIRLYHKCAPPTILFWFLLYVFGYRISFFVSSNLFYQWLVSS